MKKRITAWVSLCFVLLAASIPLLPVHAADKGMPSGFVSPKEANITSWNEMTRAVYNDLDAIYVEPLYASNDMLNKNNTAEDFFDEDSPISVSAEPLVIGKSRYKGSKDTETHVSAERHMDNGEYKMDYVLNVTFSDLSLDWYQVKAKAKGTETLYTANWQDNAGWNTWSDYTTNLDTSSELMTWNIGADGKIYLFMQFAMDKPDDVESKYWWYKGRVVYEVVGVHTGSSAVGGVTQNASDTPGEDGGVSVPAAIVIGVLGGGAAIAGAAAASGGSDGDRKKRKSYKMYVQKDFGDAIRRGGDKPVIIRARMAEVDESGAERDRNDLTANIGVSADGMAVHGAALAGRYCEATVSVPENNQNDTANITFTFMGEGGSFTNTVIFRIVDGPSLKFVDGRDGTLYHENCGIDAIPGDGFIYTERFAVVDAPVAPKLFDISAVNIGEFDVEFALTDQPALYKMTVKNNTAPDPEHDVFAKPQDKNFEIHVNVEGEKEPVKGYVTVTLYPEGITVASTMEGKKNDVKYVRVQAYEKEYAGDLDRKWQVSEIKFTLAVKGEDKAIIDPKEAEYKFDKLKGSGGLGMRADKEQSLAEKYEYKESWGDWNGKFTYTFEPNTTLVEPDDGSFFMVLLPALCEYDGETYKAEIPLRLRGKPLDPMAAWEKEYKDLTERVEKFALPENKEYWVKKITELAYDDPKCSVEELRLTSKYLIRQYMRYWTIESMKYRDEAAVYDVIVDYLEWAKFFGDCAFSILVNMYAGPVAEAIISPTKDFLAGAIGETMAAWVRGQSVDVDKFEFSKNVAAAGDNLVSGQISLTSWKQAAATLGCYFAYASIKNFILTLREENKFDLYGAIIKGFSDMTSAGLKAAAGHLFDSWLKSCPKFRAKISAWCGSFVTRHLGASASLLDLRAVDGLTRADILRKYLDGLFGMAIDKLIEKDGEIHDKFISSETGFEFDANGHLIVQIFFEVAEHHNDCTVDVTKVLANAAGTVAGFGTGGVGSDSFSDFFLFIYEELFGAIPSAAAVIAAPADPPLPPSKD